MKEERLCKVCNKPFVTGRSFQAYCSLECRRKARLITKGLNKTEFEWANLREFILERDNYTCQKCGKFAMDIGLAVHHILPLHKGGTNDTSNLLILCHKCHSKSHRAI